MDHMTQLSDYQDLAFMGKINASISHELKNIMAIISEASGLLSDLMEMGISGKTIEFNSIKKCCTHIEEEIRRGFKTIKQMNRFSHSVDEPVKIVDLNDILDFVISLAGMLSFASDVRFDGNAESDAQVETCPFRLQNLIYKSLIFAFKSAGTQGGVIVSVHKEKDAGMRISFSGFEVPESNTFPMENDQKVAASIGAQVIVDPGSRGLDILIPQLVETQ